MSCRQCLYVKACDDKDYVTENVAICSAYTHSVPGNKIALERGLLKGECSECGHEPKGRRWMKYAVISLTCPVCTGRVEIVPA